MVYRIITKVLSNRIKPKSMELISKEQFGFLHGRQIMDVIGIAYECLHSVKVKKLNALALKMDLVKAYDKVNWTFTKLLPLHNGLPYEVIEWIMSCIYLLINGRPTNFFKSERGLVKGCPLFLMFFLLFFMSRSR